MRNTVMVVDDVEVYVMILKSILEDDYNIVAADSGEMALSLMAKSQPDLVLLDLILPGINGLDVLRQMRTDPLLAHIPVIIISGEQDVEVQQKAILLGVLDYINKPYVPELLKEKVRNHLNYKIYINNLTDIISKRTKQLEERTQQLLNMHEALIMGMSMLSESRDSVTGSHLNRIKKITLLLAKKMTELYPDLLTPEEAAQIAMYSPLHDIGKVTIPDSILRKEGSLSPDEFALLKTHTTHGGELLRQMQRYLHDSDRSLLVATEIAESHHERYDGTGYPKGLAGDDIPISARIVALADVYDALRSIRPYKKSLDHHKVVDMIVKGDGTIVPSSFDPLVLRAFEKMHMELEIINE